MHSARHQCLVLLLLTLCVTTLDLGTVVERVFVPDFINDLAGSESAVLTTLGSVLGQSGRSDDTVLQPTVWRTSELWNGRELRFELERLGDISTIYVVVGAHGCNEYLLKLRDDELAILVYLEPSPIALWQLSERMEIHFGGVLSRVILIPGAISHDLAVPWTFCASSTLFGGCKHATPPHAAVGQACDAEHFFVIVSFGILLGMLLHADIETIEPTQASVLHPKLVVSISEHIGGVEILETLRDSPTLMAQFREVQLRVRSSDRRNVFERMRLLGFSLRWDLDKVTDADGLSEIAILGCRWVVEEPNSQECYFERIGGSVIGALVEHSFRRPFEFLNLQEGRGSLISFQLNALMQQYYNLLEDCDHQGRLFKCLKDAVGSTLGSLFSVADLLAEMQHVSSDELPVLLVQVFEHLFPVLDTLMWEMIHEVGAALFLFTLLVEAICRVYPFFCSIGAPRPCMGLSSSSCEASAQPSLMCVAMKDCNTHFLSLPYGEATSNVFKGHNHEELFVTQVSVLLPIFRSAQYLARQPCAPTNWNLELRLSDGSSLPSTQSNDGIHQMTALGVDSSHCSIDVSVVVLPLSLEHDFMDYHKLVWQLNEESRPLKSFDVRIATEGISWVFDCLFPSPSVPGKMLRGSAETFAFSLMQEVERVFGAPTLSVRCMVPAELLWVREGDTLPPPDFVRLVRSLRAPIDMPDVQLQIPVQRSTRPRVRSTMCAPGVFDAHGLEKMVPGHIEFWFHYHFDFLGIDEIYLYDMDNSFESLQVVEKFRRQGRLIYVDAFARVSPLQQIFKTHGFDFVTVMTASTLVQHHCWQQARHNSDWVVSSSHTWDMFLFSPRKLRFVDLLEQMPPGKVTIAHGVRYGRATGEPTRTHPNVIGRFPCHNNASLRAEVVGSAPERILIAPPRLVDGIVLVDFVPHVEARLRSNLLNGYLFAGSKMLDTHDLGVEEWRANHYVQLLGNRDVLFSPEEKHPELRAFSEFDPLAAYVGATFGNHGLR